MKETFIILQTELTREVIFQDLPFLVGLVEEENGPLGGTGDTV